jgi:hypothetical protein
MFARSSTLGLLAAVALSIPSDPATEFTFRSSGAVRLDVSGVEAKYELAPEMGADGKPVLTISLGATGSEGSLSLYTDGGQLPRAGRYPVFFSWEHPVAGGRWFHACFWAGKPDRPIGMFHGQSGWVTITDATPGRISGVFEIRAQGFLATNPSDEDQWVTLRGTFRAEGDSTLLASD